jgi:hypothetical protein
LPKPKTHSLEVTLELHTNVIDKTGNYLPSSSHFTLSQNTSMENAPPLKIPQLPTQQASMANFIMYPNPFIPLAMFLEDGGPHCHARTSVYISGGPAKTHEEFTITITEGEKTVAQRHQLMHDLSQYIVQEVQL